MHLCFIYSIYMIIVCLIITPVLVCCKLNGTGMHHQISSAELKHKVVCVSCLCWIVYGTEASVDCGLEMRTRPSLTGGKIYLMRYFTCLHFALLANKKAVCFGSRESRRQQSFLTWWCLMHLNVFLCQGLNFHPDSCVIYFYSHCPLYLWFPEPP